jgi:hypothetical protein
MISSVWIGSSSLPGSRPQVVPVEDWAAAKIPATLSGEKKSAGDVTLRTPGQIGPWRPRCVETDPSSCSISGVGGRREPFRRCTRTSASHARLEPTGTRPWRPRSAARCFGRLEKLSGRKEAAEELSNLASCYADISPMSQTNAAGPWSRSSLPRTSYKTSTRRASRPR